MINNSSLGITELKSFSLLEIQIFLKLDEWKVIEERKNVIIFQKAFNNQPIRLFLPAKEQNTDYLERVHSILNTLSILKKKSISEIIMLINNINNDVFRFRNINCVNNNLTIPLNIASQQIDAVKKLFAYSACSEENARPYFATLKTIGKNYIHECQFGHTFVGSFGFTINSPIVTDVSQLELFDTVIEKPFKRKVMERIILGFKHIKDAFQNRDVSIIVDNFETGLNSHMCDAIIDLSIDKYVNIEYSINWSSRISPITEIINFTNVILTPDLIDITIDASKKLKEVEPFPDTIIGKIITLHSNKYPFEDEEFIRTVTIKHLYGNKYIDVKLELNDKDKYQIAYDAHGKGNLIKVVGALYKKGNIWRISQVESVEEITS